MCFKYRLGRNKGVIVANIYKTIGKDAINVRKCQRWFPKFHNGIYDLDDDGEHDWTSRFDVDVLHALVKADPKVVQKTCFNNVLLTENSK